MACFMWKGGNGSGKSYYTSSIEVFVASVLVFLEEKSLTSRLILLVKYNVEVLI